MMGYMRHAVKDTYFEKWLASGGFQWPTNTNASSNKVQYRTIYTVCACSPCLNLAVAVAAAAGWLLWLRCHPLLRCV